MGTTTESLRAGSGTLLRDMLSSLQESIGPQKFNAWFKHGTSVSIDDGQVKVAVPNPFTANWIEQHYQSDLAASASLCAKKPMQVVVSIDPSLSGQCSKRKLDIQADIVSRTTQGRARHRAPIKSPTLRHTLDEFVVGECNELAYQAAKSAVSGAGHFSQIFVHGPCGVGKTHLLQGICNTLSRRDGKDGQPLRWRYVTGEQFTNEFIVAVRNRKGNEFRNRYRGLDLLAIDDVHFLAAKRATQSEFLHTFNAIEAAGKQIILASDTHPRLVGELNEQLVSRFISGLVVKIEAPDKQTRMAILKRKAKQLKLKLNTDVLEYIALHIRASVRELEGTLVKLSALAALENGKITLEITRDALADHLAQTDSAVTLGDIEAVVAAFFGITPADIHSSRRTHTVSVARMIAMSLGRRHTRMSFPEIGRFMGKNHSSVVLAVQRLDKVLAAKAELNWNTPVGTKSMPAADILKLMDEQIG